MLVLVQNYSDNRKQYGQHQNIWMQKNQQYKFNLFCIIRSCPNDYNSDSIILNVLWIQHSLLFLNVIPKPHQTDYRQDRDGMDDGNGGNVDMILCTAQGAQVEGGVDPTGGNEILW